MTLAESDLEQFTGTEEYYRHWLKCFVYTDGVRYVAEKGSAFWLIDAIASYQRSPKIQKDSMLKVFQLWELKVKDNSATLYCLRDTDDVAFKQDIEFTDFPLEEIKFYLTGGVLMLVSEY